jgi:subtilisin-like proprotein convertase family protein
MAAVNRIEPIEFFERNKCFMKRKTLTGLMTLLLVVASAQAALYTETFSPGTAIPDGNPVGVTFGGSVSDVSAGWTVSGLTLNLNISGGYNGDLYAYLVAPNGTLVMLLNQPGVAVNGFGAGGAGMNITLQDGAVANGNIQNETGGGVLSGTYNAAGSLAGFNGSVADGTWILYFADLSSGGGTSTLNSWSLGITAVPEPVNVGLGMFGGLFVLVGIVRQCRVSRRSV